MKYSVLKVQFLLLVACCLLLVASFTKAAVLYLEPSEGDYRPGDTFLVEIKIDTEECINVVGANLSFSQDILEAIDFSQGESILTLWVKLPTIDQSKGEISLIGGIPGGYCGKIPGDPGVSNLIGKIVFKVPGLMVKESGEKLAEVKFLESSQVLLSDMLGTKAKLATQGAKFKILSKPGIPRDEWQEMIEKDNIPPEPFEIEVRQDPLIFEEKYFIIFSTTDKQTGMSYYEIKEEGKDWDEAQSPYLLEDQSLQSEILVKAVDKAGNERIAEYMPPVKPKPSPYRIIILILIGAGVVWWLIKKTKIKKQNDK
ncbi:hypothetical protein KJA15_00300 [Patescibacteria group bacterium]|nr:hypothetical protein [Patescibacteria group bacterium]